MLGLLATPLSALADPPTRAAMVVALSGFETAPPIGEVRNWGPEGARLLMDIANDVNVLHHVRIRAVHALRAFDSLPAVQLFLRAFAAVPGQGLFLQRGALEALIEGFDDVSEVARYLHDARADVRDGAAWAISNSRSAAARAALEAALRTETDANVRITLTRALQNR